MIYVLFAVFVLFLVSGCEDKKPPVSGTIINTVDRARQAGDTADLNAIRKTVQAYHSANEKYPESLNEIKGMIGSEIEMSKYDYNPQTGTVSLKNN